MINKKPELFIYQKIFKLNINREKNEKKKEIHLEFEIGPHKYIISFQIEKRMFYFDVKLEKEIKDLNLM